MVILNCASRSGCAKKLPPIMDERRRRKRRIRQGKTSYALGYTVLRFNAKPPPDHLAIKPSTREHRAVWRASASGTSKRRPMSVLADLRWFSDPRACRRPLRLLRVPPACCIPSERDFGKDRKSRKRIPASYLLKRAGVTFAQWVTSLGAAAMD